MLCTKSHAIRRAVELFVIACIASCPAIAAGGTITGVVSDSVSHLPLGDVNVFLASTTRGTTTGMDGRFRIDNIAPGFYRLVASHVGYHMVALEMQIDGDESHVVNLRLGQRLLSEPEVEVIVPRPEEWHRLFAIFRKEFLGESRNAEKTRILNPEVVNLGLNPVTKMVTATSDSPVLVENRSLGYMVSAEILTFEWSTDGEFGKYEIFPRFAPLRSQNVGVEASWEVNRRETYRGSQRHFFASLIAGTLSREGFTVNTGSLMALRGGTYHPLSPEDFSLDRGASPGVWVLKFRNWWEVHFQEGRFRLTSYFAIKTGTILIDGRGSLADPLGIDVVGDWTHNRVADMLPTE